MRATLLASPTRVLSDDQPLCSASPSSTAAAALADVLPVETMDVEVFERFIMRVLTSLHRLVAKVSLDMDIGGTGSGRQPRKCDDVTTRFLWTLVRRITKRIERLRVMIPVLEEKQVVLQRAMRRADAVKDITAVQAEQSDLFLVEALIAKVLTSVTEFEQVETEMMTRLVGMGRR